MFWWFLGGIFVGVIMMGIIAGSGKNNFYSDAYSEGFAAGMQYSNRKQQTEDK